MINSAICKEKICEFFTENSASRGINLRNSLNPNLTNPKNWKRVTKRGNEAKGFVRQFRNSKVDKVLVNVHSTKTDITHVKRTVDLMTPIQKEVKTKSNETLEEMYNRYCATVPNDEGSLVNDGEYEFFYDLDFATVPRVCPYNELPEDMQDEDGPDEYYDEDLDFENWEIDRVEGNTIYMWAGGDWQLPGTFSATMREDGRLYYNGDVDYENQRYGA